MMDMDIESGLLGIGIIFTLFLIGLAILFVKYGLDNYRIDASRKKMLDNYPSFEKVYIKMLRDPAVSKKELTDFKDQFAEACGITDEI